LGCGNWRLFTVDDFMYAWVAAKEIFLSDRFVARENHAQMARCRVPTRGAAEGLLADGGLLVLVETARQEGAAAIPCKADRYWDPRWIASSI
jgi:hypothetical protein